jgi:23S rRNA (guanosine2251-2'-O)-methyltransferase
MLIYGVNPVLEALRAGTVRRLRVSATAGDRVREIRERAAKTGIAVVVVQPADLDRAAKGGVHQGVAADVDEARDYDIRELVAGARGAPLIVVLDGIEDPHNLGAILRTADAAGVDGVVRQTRHAARLDGAAAKASAGAVAHVRIANVVNIARAVNALKEAGVWTVGLDASATASYDQIEFTQPTAIVLGAEGQGLRRLVRETCDRLASIPMQGHVGSLNVSVAAAVVLFEAVRQRRRHASPPGAGQPAGR